MHELQAIVKAYSEARARGERAALATIVNVDGSAYRRPGARMLITEQGSTIGSISAGCLERDVAEHALDVMTTRQPRRIEYDTRSDDDIIWGLGLGCNGIVQILLESLHEHSDGARALDFIATCLQARQSGVIATVVQAEKISGGATQLLGCGNRLLFMPNGDRKVYLFDQDLDTAISQDARTALLENKAMLHTYETTTGTCDVFFDVITPPRSLVIIGAEADALPVVRLAKLTGWHVTVVDIKGRNLSLSRFSEADTVMLCRAENIAETLSLSPDTAVVVMTHSFLDDVTLLRTLLPTAVKYIGLLGSRPRTAKLLAAVRVEFDYLTAAHLARLHSPIGLDIGAETPEEIALSIITEIQARATQHAAGFLRDRQAPIHEEAQIRANNARPHYTTYFPTVRKTAIELVCPVS